ncbi:MAG: hypothetical protein EZS28_022427 [Streblomastix strix]|uniref:Uncharacterized protein n=1 Tax=Streblomastix strix TaxID=222440 RepID=A0A5J4VI32_9EUKA|nr:MAG: hypothetical protein EZS28_022427 [Streblomastix strix]
MLRTLVPSASSKMLVQIQMGTDNLKINGHIFSYLIFVMQSYNYAWEDFDVNGDYNIETGNKEYKFYSEKWNKKVESYLQQDLKAGRDTINSVTTDDMEEFNQMIPNKCCYSQAKFTNINNPTLE